MATTDMRNLAGQAEAPAFGRGCEAHDLKAILNTIADQIADADKRHSETLGQMQQRLAMLGGEARVMRERAPEEMVPALERIEDRMAALSSKLSEADDGRRPVVAAVMETHIAEIGGAEPPAALRSALSGDKLGSFTRREESARAAVMPEVDRFDVVSFDGSGADDEPWDQAAADALTKLYESGDAGLSAHDSPEAAEKSWKAFRSDPDWIKARDASEKDGKIVDKVESVFMTATAFSPKK